MTENSTVAPTPRKRAAHDATPSAPPRRVLTNDPAAQYIGLAPITLRKMRVAGQGPRFIKLTAVRIGYLLSDLDAWLTSRPRYQSTSEHKAESRLAAPHLPPAA